MLVVVGKVLGLGHKVTHPAISRVQLPTYHCDRQTTKACVGDRLVRRQLDRESRSLTAPRSKKMHWYLYSLVTLAYMMKGSGAGSPIDSNLYVDSLLTTLVPLHARSLGLENVSVPNCAFKVPSTAVTNRDVSVELHGGRLLGLVTPGLARRGQCSAPGWLGMNITVGCYVSLDNAHISYAGSAKGDSLLNTNRSIVLQAAPYSANALLEVTSTPGGVPRVRTWALQPFTFVVGTSPKLSLNAARQATFDKEASKCAHASLSNVLLVAYREALERAVSATRLPLP